MIGLGCMRLSTAADRDDERAITVIRTALDAGATFLDSSDAYCLDESDVGHNERLIARALAGWKGDSALITVATIGYPPVVCRSAISRIGSPLAGTCSPPTAVASDSISAFPACSSLGP